METAGMYHCGKKCISSKDLILIHVKKMKYFDEK